jgi:hypothetical protein
MLNLASGETSRVGFREDIMRTPVFAITVAGMTTLGFGNPAAKWQNDLGLNWPLAS